AGRWSGPRTSARRFVFRARDWEVNGSWSEPLQSGLRARLLQAGSSRGRCAYSPVIYLPTMMIVKDPGIAAPRPAPGPPAGGVPAGGGGGGGPTSDAIAKRWPVLLSNAMVRAPFDGHVLRSCSTSKLVGLFSLTIVIVPLPCVLNASMVAGLNAAPSELPASGRRSRILPSFALRMTNRCDGFAGSTGVPAGPMTLHAANRI